MNKKNIIVNIRHMFIKDRLDKHDPFNCGFKRGSRISDNMFVLGPTWKY